MSNETRNHKDNVFCLLYRNKKNLLSLYNAMNGTSYEGIEQGIELGSRIFKAIQSEVTDNNVIAETCECTIEEVERIRKQFGI